MQVLGHMPKALPQITDIEHSGEAEKHRSLEPPTTNDVDSLNAGDGHGKSTGAHLGVCVPVGAPKLPWRYLEGTDHV